MVEFYAPCSTLSYLPRSVHSLIAKNRAVHTLASLSNSFAICGPEVLMPRFLLLITTLKEALEQSIRMILNICWHTFSS